MKTEKQMAVARLSTEYAQMAILSVIYDLLEQNVTFTPSDGLIAANVKIEQLKLTN